MAYQNEALISEIFRLIEQQKECLATQANLAPEEAAAYQARFERIRDLVEQLSQNSPAAGALDD